MRRIGIIGLVLSLALVGGCHHCLCGKRASEQHCPTDVRKSHFWCFGEDAIFRYPCGPKEDFYGHEPTCWREWPASGSVWRDANCGPSEVAIMPYEEEMLYSPSAMPDAPLQSVPHELIEDDGSGGSPPQEILTLPPMSSARNKQMLPVSYPTTDFPDTPMVGTDDDASESGPTFEPAADSATRESLMFDFQR